MNDVKISTRLNHCEKLLSCLWGKISNPEIAGDILQERLLKALRSAPDLREEEKLLPWFYRILNNAVIDFYRRRGTRLKHDAALANELELSYEPEEEAALCACFRELIPALKPEYAQLIEKLELSGGDPAQVAGELGLTRGRVSYRVVEKFL